MEQIEVQQLGKTQTLTGWTAIPVAAVPSVLVVDAPDFDAAQVALFLSSTPRPCLLLLGVEAESATECFSKPFRLGYVMGRIRAHLEAASLPLAKSFTFGFYRLEPHHRQIHDLKKGTVIRLTEKETALLTFLAQKDAPVSRSDILAEVWGYQEGIETHTLETHIYQLRRKLDRDGETYLIGENGSWQLAPLPSEDSLPI